MNQLHKTDEELEVLRNWLNRNQFNIELNEKKKILSRLLYSLPTSGMMTLKEKIQWYEKQMVHDQWRKSLDVKWKKDLSRRLNNLELSKLVIEFLMTLDEANNSREIFVENYNKKVIQNAQELNQLETLIECANELIAINPIFKEMVSQLHIIEMKQQVKSIMEPLGINRFSQKVLYLEDQGIWGTYLLDYYSIRDLQDLEQSLVWTRDRLISYQSLEYLLQHCLSCGCQTRVLELPQEMWMGMAMCLAIPHASKRVQKAKELYEQLSTLRLDPQSSYFLEIRNCLRNRKETESPVIEKLIEKLIKNVQ